MISHIVQMFFKPYLLFCLYLSSLISFVDRLLATELTFTLENDLAIAFVVYSIDYVLELALLLSYSSFDLIYIFILFHVKVF